MNDTNKFIINLKRYRHLLTKQQIKTIRGQALSGNLEGAKKGLIRIVGKI